MATQNYIVPFCGAKTWCVGLVLLPCICFCPIDREVRAIPDGQPIPKGAYLAPVGQTMQ